MLLVANWESDVGYAWWLMENFWHVIATCMSAQGRPCVLAYPRIGAIPAIIQSSPIEVIEFPFRYHTWRDVRRGLALIRARRIRSIYLTDWPYTHWAYLLWRLAGVRRIVLHDHQPGDRPALRGVQALVKSAFHAIGAMSPTMTVAVSEYIGTRLEVNTRIPARRRTVVTNGIQPFDRGTVRSEEVRERIGIPRDAVLIVMVSRATYYKGLDFAVRCMARLLEDACLRQRVYAVHCGDGPDLDDFARMAREAGIGDNCRFLGRRQDVRDILCSADIAFHPSNGEAMSLAILEFMSAELAVLTSDLPSVCTAITPEVSGLVYRHGDVDAAVASLRRLIDDAGLRRSLGRTAAASVRTHYTLETTNRTFTERVVPAL